MTESPYQTELTERIAEMKEEGEGSRGQYYELYGSAIQPALSPLAQLFEAALPTHPKLVELAILSLDQMTHTDYFRDLEDELAQEAMEAADAEAADAEVSVDKSANCLWKFFWDCGRQGEVEGTFVASRQEIEDALGKTVYLGEALGKHSEVYGDLEEKDVTLLSANGSVVELFLQHIGSVGYDPLDPEYLQD